MSVIFDFHLVCLTLRIAVRGDGAQYSAIEQIARHTTILFSTLNSIKHPLPSRDQRPPGTEPILWGIPTVPARDVNDLKSTKEMDTQEVRRNDTFLCRLLTTQSS